MGSKLLRRPGIVWLAIGVTVCAAGYAGVAEATTQTAPVTDLAVTSITADKTSVQPGDIVHFTVKWRNRGSSDVGNFQGVPKVAGGTVIAADCQGVGADGTFCEYYLGAGDTRTGVYTVRVAKAGAVTFRASMLDDGVVDTDPWNDWRGLTVN